MSEHPPSNSGEEFTRLLVKNQTRVWALILSLVPNGPDADDVMQETCAVMWRKFDEFQGNTDFGAWALRIARFQVMTYYNRRRRARAHVSDETIEAITETLAAPRWQSSALAEALRHCLGKLKERDLDLVQRRYGMEEGVEEIAAAVGGTLQAVYKALARLQARLLGCVQARLREEHSA
jgi:RNA polymerase sigma-70 factor, ECF subfamily